MLEHKLGVIGGSGLYDLEGLADRQTHRLHTPFGEPSGEYLSGSLNGQP
ncbi:MAG: S-methyl-5'-thioadenosine phosphorylase, partial [Deltaproteobacteria bacterium]